jgi:hypothetical protein
MYLFEATCMIQVRAQAGGGELIPIPSKVLEGAVGMAKAATRGAGGGLAWPGLLRKLDRVDPSFRT